MKKVMIYGLIIISLIVLAGCAQYENLNVQNDEDLSLIDEIAKIEQELAQEGVDEEVNVTEEVVEEEVVLPNLDEEVLMNTEAVTVSVKENELVKINAKVSDPDEDPVTYTFTKPLNNNGEWKTNYGDAGEYLITLAATDGKLTTEQVIKLVVERVNVPPVIEGVKDVLIIEGETVTFEPKVSDPNNDPVTVTVSEPLKSGTFVTDHTSSGEYNIVVSASDGELDSEKTFKLTVNDLNVKPIISEIDNLRIKEGEVVKIKPKVTDLDDDPIVITISDPVGDDGIWETSFIDNGEYVITITADDGKDKVTQKITITIDDINMPPEIVEISLGDQNSQLSS